MPDKQSNPSIPLPHQGSADASMKSAKITHDLVMAVSERVYGMLLRELKVEGERQRFLKGSQRK